MYISYVISFFLLFIFTCCNSHNLFEGLSAEIGKSNCEFKCENGKVPKPRKSHSPKSNGCGAYGLQLNTDGIPDAVGCCDDHDYCYDTCNNNRKVCDDKFSQCLKNKCKQHTSKKFKKDCLEISKIMSAGASMFGCNTFLESQKKACQCVKVHKEL